MKPTILLCMIRGADHLAEALLDRADIEILTLYQATSALLTASGIPNRSLNEFITDDLRARAVDETNRRTKVIADVLCGDDLRAAYRLDTRTWASIRSGLAKALQRDLAEEILTIDAFFRAVQKTDLRLVLVPEDICRDTKTVVYAARRLGIPSLHLLHGFLYGTRNAHTEVNVDAVAAYSEDSKRTYDSFCGPGSRVVATGNPMWDLYASPPMPQRKEAACERLGLDPHRPIIEYALTGVHRFSAVSIQHPVYHLLSAEAVLRAFASLATDHPDWQFVLRDHPSRTGDMDRLTAYAAQLGLKGVAVDNQSPYDTIVMVDLLLCTHSNLGIEAFLFGKPVINVAIDDLAGPVFREGIGPLFLEDDAVLWARTEEDIAPAITAALLDRATQDRLRGLRPASIRRFNLANDGRATQHFCELALDMVANAPHYTRPVDRWPQFEPLLAEAVPEDARSILVLGKAAMHAANSVKASRPAASVTACDSTPAPAGEWDAVVLSEPLSHRLEAEAALRAAIRVAGRGTVIAPFRLCTPEEARRILDEGDWVPPRPGAEAPGGPEGLPEEGIRILLSRVGLEPQGDWLLPRFASGVVICSRARETGPGEYGRKRIEEKNEARRKNAQGEALFAQEDFTGAFKCFVDAVALCNTEAVFYSNLAAALHMMGQPEDAYERLMDALYLDPDCQAARDNARMIGAALSRLDEVERILRLFGRDRSR